ncbi:MAG: ferrochelatase [Gemmatimonas sp.]
MSARVGVVLFNLGGPDNPAAVEPFLVNLFNDPAIIRVPQPLRYVIARLIARRRAPLAREIYERLGGSSPIVRETRAQASALEAELVKRDPVTAFKVVMAMRYWMPRSDEAAAALAEWKPDSLVLLPLYPQFSTTTTSSSLADWHRAASERGLTAATRAICCWPTEPGLIRTFVDSLVPILRSDRSLRVLFSAHGLPEKIVKAGDPYPGQVMATTRAVVETLAEEGFTDLDWVVCYQSRVGPLRWIGPSTDEEIRRAGADGRGVIVVPIAFVSEHSETLVELDQEYRKLATASGVPRYERTPTPSVSAPFIAGLADLVRSAMAQSAPMSSGSPHRACTPVSQCPLVRVR